MANWIIPCNPKYFDVFGAFGKLKTIDWNQSAKSIDVGDIVYIYVGKPVQAIMFKTRVLATGITADEVDYSDQEFDLEDNQASVGPDRDKRWMRLELIKCYSNRDLSFNKLVQYGLKGNIQGPRRTDEGIQELIDLVDPPTEEHIQPTNASGTHEDIDQNNWQDDNKDYKVNTDSAQRSISTNAGKDNRRIEKKLDSLISAISAMSTKKGTSEDVKKETEIETDKRFRIEITNGTAIFLMLNSPLVITGLAFGVKLYAIGSDGSSDRFRIFFTTQEGNKLSEMQEIVVTVGGEYECRFELKTSASEEEAVFLAIQSISGKEDEVRQLIKCPVKIAFAADFGI